MSSDDVADEVSEEGVSEDPFNQEANLSKPNVEAINPNNDTKRMQMMLISIFFAFFTCFLC